MNTIKTLIKVTLFINYDPRCRFLIEVEIILPRECRFINLGGHVVIRGSFSHAKVTPTIP